MLEGYCFPRSAMPGEPIPLHVSTDAANFDVEVARDGAVSEVVWRTRGVAGEVHQVEIHDARLHYHERTDEFYYIIDGEGTMTLDDEEIELHQGVVVYVPRGVKHKACGNLKVLLVCVPRGVLNDVHELE